MEEHCWDNPFDLLDIMGLIGLHRGEDGGLVTLALPIGPYDLWSDQSADPWPAIREERGANDDANTAIIAFTVSP